MTTRLFVVLLLLVAGLAVAQTGSDPSLKLEPLDLGTAEDEDPVIVEPEPEWVEGRGENELVLIHGLGASAELWHDMLPFLNNTFKVHVYELHGHGKTPAVKDPSIVSEAQALHRWIQEQGLTYPSLVGHGLGGMVALQYAFDHPGDINRLVVIDAGPRQLASKEQKAEVAAALLDDYDRFVASQFLNLSVMPDVNEKAVDWALRTDAVTFSSLLMSSFDWDLSGRLHQQSVPMLVVGSAAYLPEPGNERGYLESYGYGDARVLSFKRVADTGHYLMLEKATYVASVIMVFIKADSYK